jgi:Cu(I)/Ag(I) efflux system protein CusF
MLKSRFTRLDAGIIALTVSLLAGMPMRASAQDFIDGQVTKVDQGAGKITIKHGPIRKLGMDEGMTMVFRAGDPAMLKSVKAGDKIRFAPDLVDGQFTVTKNPEGEVTPWPPRYDRFGAGAGTPGIFTRTEPSVVRLVKNRVFQSSPPNARLVVCGLPWTMRPSFLPLGSMT